MFGYEMTEIKQKKADNKKKVEENRKNKEENRKLELAKERLEIIKKFLQQKAKNGEDLIIKIFDDIDSIDSKENINNYFDKLRELGWEEGISIVHKSKNDNTEYYASIENLFQDFDINRYIYIKAENLLTDEEKTYIDSEKKFFEQLKNGKSIDDIYSECLLQLYSSPKRRALANAAYRIGMEGTIHTLEIEPTYWVYIDSSKIDKMAYENYIQIMHRYYKEQNEKNNQKQNQKAKTPKTG